MIDSPNIALLSTNLSIHFFFCQWHAIVIEWKNVSEYFHVSFSIQSLLDPVQVRKDILWIIMTKRENMGHCKTWMQQFTQKPFVAIPILY